MASAHSVSTFLPGKPGRIRMVKTGRREKAVLLPFCVNKRKSSSRSNPSASHWQEDQQVSQEVPPTSLSVHQPGAEINKIWDFSDGVVSGGRTLCLSPGHRSPRPLIPSRLRCLRARSPKVAAQCKRIVLLFPGSMLLPEEAH